MTPPPAAAAVSRCVGLVMRLLTIVCLVISLIVITTNNATLPDINLGEIKIHFQDVKAYRYMLGTIVIGIAYTLVFTLYQVSSGNRMGGDGLSYFEFYGDKFISYLLATGVGAGFGATIDLKDSNSGTSSEIDKFFTKATAAASMLLIAFVFTAISSILSSLSLPKRQAG